MAQVQAHDYDSPLGGKVPALLVLPESGHPRAGILFLHPASGDKTAFLEDARTLADANSAACLLIDAPFRRPEGRRGGFADPETEARNLTQTLADLRRGIDVLLALPGVREVHFVGRNFGAAMGGVLAGAENRVASYVLIAGLPAMSEFWSGSGYPLAREARARATPDQIEEFVWKTSRFDGVSHIGEAAPARVLFQFGRQDDWIPEPVANQYIAAASAPKQVHWYDADHEMDTPHVLEDYARFLFPSGPNNA
jgi:dienelactone hydrolase